MTASTPGVTTTQVHQIFVKANPDEIWEAITKPEFSAKYFYGAKVETTAEAGTPFRQYSPDGTTLWVDELVLESDRPRHLVIGWRALYDPNLADEPSSRVSWDIELQDGGYCLPTVTHDRLEGAPKTAASVAGVGWMLVLSGLKTVLETGNSLVGD